MAESEKHTLDCGGIEEEIVFHVSRTERAIMACKEHYSKYLEDRGH